MATDSKYPTTLSFRVAPPLEAELARRSEEKSLGNVARRDLERYYDLLRRELLTVTLSEPEASLVIDVCNGTLFEPHSVSLLWAEIADGIRLGGVDTKWGVDGDALVSKLRALSPGQAYAVVDAVERFWSGPYRTLTTNEGLRAVGLIR